MYPAAAQTDRGSVPTAVAAVDVVEADSPRKPCFFVLWGNVTPSNQILAEGSLYSFDSHSSYAIKPV